jgi:hypothetical protein
MENQIVIEGFIGNIFYNDDGSRANGKLWFGKQYNSDKDKMIDFIGFNGKIPAGFKSKDRVIIKGFLNQRTWTNKEDEEVTTTQIVVNEMSKSTKKDKGQAATAKKKAPVSKPTEAEEDAPF